jgi:uncharacterized protein YgiM (DUF1202 family)
LAAVVAMAWVFHREAEPDGSRIIKRIRAQAAVASESKTLPVDTAVQQGNVRLDTLDTTVSPTTIMPTDGPARNAAVVSPAGTPVVDATSSAAPPPSIATSPAMATPAMNLRASSRSKRGPRWVSSVSRDWVVVRRDASNQSRIVASIGPNSHVQLGETRGSWRRIRARGLAGWVEPRSLFDVAAR